jgi:broad specificity phosphatase PhoE
MADDRRNPSVWKNLLLLRHGESTANEVNRFAGEIDAPLTELGQAQARVAAEKWFGGDVDRVYVSPLRRTRETADIVMEGVGLTASESPEILFDDRLRERQFGDFTLGNKTALQRRFGLLSYERALYHSNGHPPGAEPFVAFRERILDFLKREVYPALCLGKRVLIVAHKYVIELLSRLVLRLPDAKGHDLRLPNAAVILGSHLAQYVRRESPVRNRLNDWIVVNHAAVLSVAALIGLLSQAADAVVAPPRWVLLLLLGIAAAISLARVSLSSPPGSIGTPLVSSSRLFLRFMLLPWIVTIGLTSLWPVGAMAWSDYLMAIGLLLAAPSAVTAVVLSRTSGGMILPTALAVLVSTAMSLANTVALLAYFGQADLMFQASLFVVVSSGSLLLPLLIAQFARRRFPVVVAKAAEDHGAWAVLALALFVVLSFQHISLNSFYPGGIVALALGIGLRFLALTLSRQSSLYGVDDYFSMGYPNIFLVIVLAGLMGNEPLLNIATWFLVPMFVFTPMDDVLIKRMLRSQSRLGLFSYLNIEGDAHAWSKNSAAVAARQAEQEG